MKIELVMLYWTDGAPDSTRTRNCQFAWKQLQQLERYLIDNNISITCKLIDHSPEQVITDGNVIHDPYPIGTYKRSEKINKVLFGTDSNFIGIMDSDAFFYSNQFTLIKEMIDNLKDKNVYTFDLKDINNWESILDFNTGSMKYLEVDYTSRFPDLQNPGLGGFFICCTDTLKSKGGFNEEFTTWGGEDGEVFSKLWDDNSVKTQKMFDLNLWHIPHFCDRENVLYFNRDEYIRLNY